MRNLTTFFILVLAIFISIGATFFTLNKLSDYQLTGLASSDAGEGTIAISPSVAIEVNSTDNLHNSIDFGACAPVTGGLILESNYSGDPNQGAYGNCTESFPRYIQVVNVGNTDANVTIQSDMNASVFIGGTVPLFQYVTFDGDEGAGVDHYGGCTACSDSSGCSGAISTQDSWNELSVPNTEYYACQNLSYKAGKRSNFKTFLRVSIPSDSVPGSHVAVLTYTASQII